MRSKSVSVHALSIHNKHTKSSGQTERYAETQRSLKKSQQQHVSQISHNKSANSSQQIYNQDESTQVQKDRIENSYSLPPEPKKDTLKSRQPPFQYHSSKKLAEELNGIIISIDNREYVENRPSSARLLTKEPLDEFNFSPQKSTKKSTSVLGNTSGLKATSMIPISKTEIVGLSSFQSQLQTTQNQYQTAQKTTINRLGLSLKPLCSFHKNQQIKFVCLDAECNSRERVICSECIEEQGHSFHELKSIQEYLLLIQSSKETFDRKYYYIKQTLENLQNPPLFNEMFLKINEIKTQICTKLDGIKESIQNQYKTCLQGLNSNDSAKKQKGSSNSYLPSKSLKHFSSELISYPAILKEADRLEEIKHFWEEIHTKNFYNLSKSEINTSAAMIQSKSFLSLEQLSLSLTQKFNSLSSLFTDTANMYTEHVSQCLHQVFDFNKLEIPPTSNSSDIALNQLQNNLFQIEHEIKGKRQQMKLVMLQIQTHSSKQTNTGIQNTLQSNLFPYNSYSTPCAHLVQRGEQGNTVPIFECCQQAFQCVQCHLMLSKHTPKITNPSKRYCMKCLSIFKVNYPTDQSINCNDCLK